MARQRIELLGIGFDPFSGEEIAHLIGESARGREKLWVSTANLDWVMIAQSREEFREQLEASDVVTCDGAPVMALSKIAGRPIPHRVTGVEIFERLRRGEGGALRIGFFGAEGHEAERASEVLNTEDTPLIGAGGYNPGHGSVEALSAERHLAAVNAMNADFLVLALGAEKGQDWIARNHDKINVPVVSHLGAVVRHVSGDTIPAPKIMSQIGMEWAYRAWKEPALRSRYLRNFGALPGLMDAAWKSRG